MYIVYIIPMVWKKETDILESLGYSLQYSKVSQKIKENEYSDIRRQVKSWWYI